MSEVTPKTPRVQIPENTQRIEVTSLRLSPELSGQVMLIIESKGCLTEPSGTAGAFTFKVVRRLAPKSIQDLEELLNGLAGMYPEMEVLCT